MGRTLALILLLGLSCFSSPIAATQTDSAAETQHQAIGEITYEVNKDGGYDFYRDAKRIAYSRRGRRAGCQTLYALADKKIKKDDTIVEVTPAMSLWLDADNQRRRLRPKTSTHSKLYCGRSRTKMAGNRFPLPLSKECRQMRNQHRSTKIRGSLKALMRRRRKLAFSRITRTREAGTPLRRTKPYCSSHFPTSRPRQVENMVLPIIGTSQVPFGGQTVYRSQIIRNGSDEWHRIDTPIAKWTRDTPAGKFHLSILTEANETRLKLKSIVPVLERAEHGRVKPLLAAVILVRLAVGISGADDTPLQPSTVTPENDVRLAKLTMPNRRRLAYSRIIRTWQAASPSWRGRTSRSTQFPIWRPVPT